MPLPKKLSVGANGQKENGFRHSFRPGAKRSTDIRIECSCSAAVLMPFSAAFSVLSCSSAFDVLSFSFSNAKILRARVAVSERGRGALRLARRSD